MTQTRSPQDQPDSAGRQGREGHLLVGRYRLLATIGSGGMGTVWSAVDEVLGREVAIKEIRPPADLPAGERRVLRERSLREARAAARLSTASAIAVYDVVEEGDRPWIVMQKLSAPSLSDILNRDGPLPPGRVAEIGLQLVDALGAAHAAGVVHRDVKPSNVVLMEDGRAVLTDFGIATVTGEPTLTASGLVVGSPAYIAPERARGEPPTPAADLWSLGVTLWAAVEGGSPFQRDDPVATLDAVVHENTPLAAHAGALAPVIYLLLAKDPNGRPDLRQTRRMLQKALRVERGELAATGSIPVIAATAPVTVQPPDAGTQPPPEPAPTPGPEPVPQRVPEPVPEPVPGPVPEPAPGPLAEEALSPLGPLTRRNPRGAHRLGGRNRRMAIIAVALAVTLLIAALIQTLGNGSGERARGTPARSSTATPVSPSRSPTSTPTPTATQPNPPGIPAGFAMVSDPTGFRIAVPKGWKRFTNGSRTYYREPAGRRFLMIDQTTTPKGDPLADWRKQELSASSRLTGYQRIALKRVDYRGWNAADWEFSWVSGDTRLHVLNRNIRISNRRAYAVYWSTPASGWSGSLLYLQAFLRTFQPAT